MSKIHKEYLRLNVSTKKTRRVRPFRAIFKLLLTCIYLVRSALVGGPGVSFHLNIIRQAIGLVGSKYTLSKVYKLISSPLDSFRYFEFEFFWKSISARAPLGSYLDVSSPRLFSWRVLTSGKACRALISNPDPTDLAETRWLFSATGLSDRCRLSGAKISEMAETPESFDMVVCISVLEHIPADTAPAALRKMWKLVKPGGCLLLSLPCACTGFEEYVDFDEYGLLEPTADGFVFGQRFYDQKMLEVDIFSIVGTPARSAIYGEKMVGSFLHNRDQKLACADYPFYRESYMMATQYRYFDHIESMPGLGVVAFEFIKP